MPQSLLGWYSDPIKSWGMPHIWKVNRKFSPRMASRNKEHSFWDLSVSPPILLSQSSGSRGWSLSPLASYPQSKGERKTKLDLLEAADSRCFSPSSSRTGTLCPKRSMLPNSLDILILHKPFWLLSNYSNSLLSSCLIIQLIEWFSILNEL